ncbi:MFS transporter [Pseudomonadota bacterium AL_CKDN230030165-1A_HGKHYDSX7]
MNADTRLAAAGFGLIAVCYGFARFAFGLFLPQIDAELSLPPLLAGLISGGSFLGYCLAIVASAWLTERLGARTAALAAAAIAAAGMAGIALSPTAVWLALAVLLAGVSTGLVSPPLAAAVSTGVAPKRRDTVNTIINAGTSAGVALAGGIALMLSLPWRGVYALFVASALLMALAIARSLPRATGAQGKPPGGLPRLNPSLKRLIVASLLTGAASTAVWSFGGKLITLRLGWNETEAGWLWIAIGIAGIAGASAGWLMARLGLRKVHVLFLAALAAGTLLVGKAGTTAALALAGGALFGLAYITLTGVYLVWGVTALPQRPATGLTISFLFLAIGQTLGAPLFAAVMSHVSPDAAVIGFAALALIAGLVRAEPDRGRCKRTS